jgi:transcriptional regulator with XRE-family HTH domain
MTGRRADSIDALVGRNIKLHRQAKHLSQAELGEKLGITFQQVQKYEKGTNRVGSGRLFRIAEVLEVPLTTFFEGTKALAFGKQVHPLELISNPHSLRLLQAFSRIDDERIRRSLVTLVENIAGSQ